ncbi:MAG: 7-cyano-7-deazaguanine synthase, partial [Campylobacter sp.]|nr:7-cyano-7-deazaguanine synthase [Campylobacter sp.]
MKALCVISGGMDSAVAAAIAKRDGYEILGLHFDYKQRTQSRERQCFYDICSDLGAKSFVFDASFIAGIGGSALTDLSLEVPKNRKELFEPAKNSEPPITYVPFRNGIFLSI